MAENKSKRNLGIIGLVVLGGVAIYGASSLLSNNEEGDEAVEQVDPNKPDSAKVNAVASSEAEVTPGESNDKVFNELQEQENKQRLETARAEGESHISTLVNNSNDGKVDPLESVSDAELAQKEPEKVEVQAPVEPVVEEPVITAEMPQTQEFKPVMEKPKYTAVVKAQANDLESYYFSKYAGGLKDKEADKYVPKLEHDYSNGASSGMENDVSAGGKVSTDNLSMEKDYSWGDAPTSLTNKQPNMKVGAKANTAGSAEGSVDDVEGYGGDKSVSAGGYGLDGKEPSSIPTYVRMGEILSGRIEIGVNTDEPGPVMATITTGPKELIGSRLMGEVVSAPTSVGALNQTAQIRFNKLMKTDGSGSYDVDVYAVSPKTSRPGVVSSIDNHYFARYVVGLASEFLSGIGSAYKQAGNTTVVTGSGTTVTSMADDTKKIMRSGLGGVGERLGREVGIYSNRPATIIVNAGEPIGLLFMNDF